MKLIRKISQSHKNIVIYIVGLATTGEWAQLENESNGCIKIIRDQQDIYTYQSAADVYLDSIPLGSFEEAIEAGARGIPVVGLATEIVTHFSEDIAPGILKTHFHNLDELLLVIDKLVSR